MARYGSAAFSQGAGWCCWGEDFGEDGGEGFIVMVGGGDQGEGGRGMSVGRLAVAGIVVDFSLGDFDFCVIPLFEFILRLLLL